MRRAMADHRRQGTAPTLLELGDIVIAALVPSHPDAPPAEVVLLEEPESGLRTTRATYDTFPGEFFGSDESIGERYRLIMGPGLDGELTVFDVEAQSLCTRGVDPSTGFCV